jgi:hypothetical protein
MSETFTPDSLIAGDFPIVTKAVTVAQAAGALARGTILGKLTSGGKVVMQNTAASDGSQNDYAVLVEAVDATAGDVVAAAYLTGEFNQAALVCATLGAASRESTMRALSMFQKTVVAA